MRKHSAKAGSSAFSNIEDPFINPSAYCRCIPNIVNTDDYTKPGMHWVAFYVDESSNGLYFDSFGLPPIIADHINRLRKNCKTFRWNAIQLQNDGSDVCDQYCIVFILYELQFRFQEVSRQFF